MVWRTWIPVVVPAILIPPLGMTQEISKLLLYAYIYVSIHIQEAKRKVVCKRRIGLILQPSLSIDFCRINPCLSDLQKLKIERFYYEKLCKQNYLNLY